MSYDMRQNARYATDDLMDRRSGLSYAQMRDAVILDSLPYGRWVTKTGEEYYFNRFEEVIFACNPLTGALLPTARDMKVVGIDDRKTLRFFDSSQDVANKVKLMVKPVVIYYDFMLRFARPNGCMRYFNGMVSGRPKELMKHTMLMDNLPYGYYIAETGEEYYFSREYDIILGWDPQRVQIIPTHRNMAVDGRLEMRHLYDASVFGRSMSEDRRAMQYSLHIWDTIHRLHEETKQMNGRMRAHAE